MSTPASNTVDTTVDAQPVSALLAKPEGAHIVQFYETDGQLDAAVATYLHAGFAAGEPAVVIATPEHCDGFERALAARDVDLAAAQRARRIVILDARETLATFMVDGVPDAAKFEASIGALVAQLVEQNHGRPVRAYGEMVDVLWREGNSRGALALEHLWNELGHRHAFSLFCAYVMSSFFTEQSGAGLNAICDSHSHVLPLPSNIREDVDRLRERARLLENEIEKRKQLEIALRDALEAKTAAQEHLEALYRITGALHAELELEKVVQRLTDEATAICHAQFGAFFYNVVGESGESYTLYTLAGVPREHFAKFPMPRNTAIFAPTFRGEGVVRIADVTKDPRYGKNAPYHGMPEGHLPVCSYLAVPVIARTGEVLGGLFFGHSKPGVFTARDEAIVTAVAKQAGAAIENARLYEQKRRDAETQRRAAEFAERARQRTAKLHRLAVELSRALTAEDAVRIVTREIETVIHAEPAGVLLGYGASDQSDLSADTAIAEAARTGQLVWRVGTPTVGAMPINFEGRVLGAIGFRHVQALPLTDDERDFLLVVGRQCGQAIERARLHDASQAARAEAEQASRAKDEFLAMLGHELRNPLSPILTAVHLMRLRGETSSKREQEVIERQVNHLIHIVDDLLDISRIARGKVTLEQKPVLLGSVLAKAIETAMPLIHQQRHRLDVDPVPNVWLNADESRLCQVFTNILMNAAKYTPPGGIIRIAVERPGDRVSVRVRDTGVGIPPELLPRIFDLFVQGLRGADRAQGGLGIGLSLVRNLVTMHGGSVAAHSAGPGRGTEIIVELPVLDAVPDSAAADAQPARRASVHSRRVLVVDDNEDGASLMGDMLRSVGHDVVVASDGPGALAAIDRFAPEIGVLDIGLPGMDGYALATALRERLGKDLYLMAVTGYGQPQDRVRAERAGFDAHFVKPVSLSVLLAFIDGRA
jgi:signal transduction histidine kinase/CheY-like chemotaxis protein